MDEQPLPIDDAKIKVENLTKIFGKNVDRALAMMRKGESKEDILKKTGSTVGVNNVSFHVRTGEIFVVMGLSGSGKSTLIRCLNRLHEPTSGSVHVDGTDVTQINETELRTLRRHKYGMVFQRFALFPHRSVVGNVEYGLEVQGEPPEKRRQRAMEVLELVGLAGWEYSRPDQLSGGMQQRVGLARALAVDPDILLMDEAFSALDPLIKREMQDELLALQERVAKTIVFITHDLDEALKLGDRIAMMRDGEIVQIGTPEEIIREPATEYVASFTKGVDRSKILTAAALMKKPVTVVTPKDGPHRALHEMQRHGLSCVYAVDRKGTLVGLVPVEAAAEAAEEGVKTLEDIVEEAITVDPDAEAQEVMRICARLSGPVAVVDHNGRLQGVIVKGAILSALAERGVKPVAEAV